MQVADGQVAAICAALPPLEEWMKKYTEQRPAAEQYVGEHESMAARNGTVR